MSNISTGVFEIIPDDDDDVAIPTEPEQEQEVAEPEVPTPTTLDESVIRGYMQQAVNDGYAYNVCQEAAKLATTEIKTYEDFEELLSKVVENKQAAITKQNIKDRRIKDSVQVELASLRKYPDITTRADTVIQNTYNTTAVLAMDIIERASPEELCLELYEKPVYSVMLQVNKDWVKEKVEIVHKSWENNEYANKCIEAYLTGLGVTKETMEGNKQALVQLLPKSVQTESSPDTYKQFLAVQLISRRDNPQEESRLSNGIMSNQVSRVEYGAVLREAVESGQPLQVANAEATEEALNALVNKKRSLGDNVVGAAGAVGAFCGKAINIRYKAATTFDEMLRENAGKYANDWTSSRNEIHARKEERRQMKEERVHQERMAKMESEARVAEAKVSQMQHQPQPTQFIQQEGSGNFAPKVPPFAQMVIAHVIAYFIIWILFGGLTSSVFLFGLIVALIGYFKKKAGAHDYIIVILAGYMICLLAIVFN